jgi:hypothetical protein
MRTISHALTTETDVTETHSPQVGIFWMISVTDGARLLASSCTLNKIIRHIQAKVRIERGYTVIQSHRPAQTDANRELLLDWLRQRARKVCGEDREMRLTLFSA